MNAQRWAVIGLGIALGLPTACDEDDPGPDETTGVDATGGTDSDDPSTTSSTTGETGASSASGASGASGPGTQPSCAVEGQACEDTDCCEGLSCQPEGCVVIPEGCAELEADCSEAECCPGYTCDETTSTCIEP